MREAVGAEYCERRVGHDRRLPRRAGLPRRSGVKKYWEDTVRRWGGDITFSVEEVIDQGETVVCVTRVRGRGAESGVPIDARWVHVWEYRDGAVVRCRTVETVGIEPTSAES